MTPHTARHERLLRQLVALSAATLAFAIPASASAAIAPGTYKGQTNQNHTVHAKIAKGKLKRLSFSLVTRCGIGGSEGSQTDVLLVENVKIKSNGKFTAKSVGDSTNGFATFELVGKATAERITGSVEQFFRNGCQVFELEFTAKRR